MAHRFILPPAIALGATLAVNSSFRGSPLRFSNTLHCEGPFSSVEAQWLSNRNPNPMAPAPPKDRSGFSPTTYRQISSGSFFGVAVGLLVARFGKTISLIIGGIMILIETLARQDVDVIPYDRLRRWVGNLDIKGLVMKNTPFKVAFGTSFMIASVYG